MSILSLVVDFLDWSTLFQHMIQNLQTSGIKINTQITVFPIMKFWYKHINTIGLSPWAFFFSFSRVTSDIIYSRERERERTNSSRWASKTCLSHCLLYRKLEFEYTVDQLSCSINGDKLRSQFPHLQASTKPELHLKPYEKPLRWSVFVPKQIILATILYVCQRNLGSCTCINLSMLFWWWRFTQSHDNVEPDCLLKLPP